MGDVRRMRSSGPPVMLSALLVTGLACSANPHDRTFSLPPAPFARPTNLTTTVGTTESLVADSLTREKIERLHAQTLHQGVIVDSAEPHGYRMGLVPTVFARETGAGGDSGPEWLAFHDAETTISANDAAALLHHEDPVIRVYFAWHAGKAEENGQMTNEQLANLLYPLLLDSTPVDVRFGCSTDHRTVAKSAMETLANTSDPRNRCGRAEIFKTLSEDERLAPDVRAIALQSFAWTRGD